MTWLPSTAPTRPSGLNSQDIVEFASSRWFVFLWGGRNALESVGEALGVCAHIPQQKNIWYSKPNQGTVQHDRKRGLIYKTEQNEQQSCVFTKTNQNKVTTHYFYIYIYIPIVLPTLFPSLVFFKFQVLSGNFSKNFLALGAWSRMWVGGIPKTSTILFIWSTCPK